jgi:cytochrome c-type biogenesis protein CcmE
MKKTHIIVLVLLAVGIAMIISTYKDASSFVSFKEAAEVPEKSFHVKTTLVKDKPIEYNPEQDAERFTFYAVDEFGEERKVICYKEKPFDFERAEEVVLIGKINGVNEFVASEYQTKCPSKYEDEVGDI